jgi:hypothetical protein
VNRDGGLVIDLASALCAGAVIVVGVQLTLQTAIDVASGTPAAGRLVGALLDWSPWLVAAGLMRVAAPRVAARTDVEGGTPSPHRRLDVFDAAGALFVTGALAWAAATILVRVTAASTIGSWDADGRALLDPAYYTDLLMAFLPWVLGGAALRAAARHL